MNSNMTGNAAVGIAIAYFTKQSHPVCIPLTDTQSYDLVVDMGGVGLDDPRLCKVQVKYTSYKKRGNYSADLRVKGGNRTGTGKTKLFSAEDADWLFIVTPEGSWLIPTTEVGTSAVVLGEKYRRYQVGQEGFEPPKP